MDLPDIQMIALDIDDTLLTSRGTIPPEVLAAIHRAQDAGIAITLATGRAYRITDPIAQQLNIQTPLVTNNGSVVRSQTGFLFHWPIRHAALGRVLHAAERYGLTPLLFYGDDVLAAAPDDRTRYYVSLGGLQPVYVGDLPSWVRDLPTGDGVSNILLVGEEDQVADVLPRLRDEFAGQLQVSRSKPELIELTADGVSKWKALKHLGAHLGIAPRNMMAIGDSLNDLEMLVHAGVGVAVANAPDSVQTAADLVVPSNDEGGVALAINRCIAQRPAS